MRQVSMTSPSESVVSSSRTSPESPYQMQARYATYLRPALPETGAHPSSNTLATVVSILLSGQLLLELKKDGKELLKDRNEPVFY